MITEERRIAPLPDTRPLLFDHVPKTAGSTVKRILAERYPSGILAVAPNSTRFADFVRQTPAGAALCGHFSFLPGDDALLARYFSATVLRDPVERLLSSYFFTRSLGSQGVPSLDLASELPFDAWLEHVYTTNPELVSNVTARHFAVLAGDEPLPQGQEALLEAAIRGLDRFDLVGTTEELRTFVDSLVLACGLAPVEELPRENRTPFDPARATAFAAARSFVEERSNADLALYRHALARSRRDASEICRRAATTLRDLSHSKASGHVDPSESTAGSVQEVAPDALDERRVEFGNGLVRIAAVSLTHPDQFDAPLQSGRQVELTVVADAASAVDDLTVGFAIKTAQGLLVYGTNSQLLLGHGLRILRPGRIVVRFRFLNRLGHAGYRIAIALHRGLDHSLECFHWLDPALEVVVHPGPNRIFEGVADLCASIEFMPEARAI